MAGVNWNKINAFFTESKSESLGSISGISAESNLIMAYVLERVLSIKEAHHLQLDIKELTFQVCAGNTCNNFDFKKDIRNGLTVNEAIAKMSKNTNENSAQKIDSRFGPGSYEKLKKFSEKLYEVAMKYGAKQPSKENKSRPSFNTPEQQMAQDDQRKRQEAENNHQKYDYTPKPPINDWMG